MTDINPKLQANVNSDLQYFIGSEKIIFQTLTNDR